MSRKLKDTYRTQLRVLEQLLEQSTARLFRYWPLDDCPSAAQLTAAADVATAAALPRPQKRRPLLFAQPPFSLSTTINLPSVYHTSRLLSRRRPMRSTSSRPGLALLALIALLIVLIVLAICFTRTPVLETPLP